MKTVLKAIESITNWSGKIVSYLVWIGAIMLSWEVVARYWFNAPTVWAHGYSQRLFGTYFILIGAFTLLRGGHVRVDLITSRFSLRTRKLFDLLNYGFLILWAVVLIREGWLFFLDSWSMREVDEMVLAHPVYPFKFMILLGSVLILLQGVVSVIKTIASFGKGETE
jgi:TRAP-type mannitol/chloroaromatic compound transport system permease small subunit